ncbi:MAG: class I SAM-dependent methyltransferase [Terriglobia bacterium]|jgi:SAM-dependent methyltransferase
MKAETVRAEKDLEATYWWFVGRRVILDRILRRSGKRGRVAVDVGCGSGRNMQILSRYADWVMGVDRSPAALELAASHRYPLACADGQAIPLADSSADLLSSLDVLEHLENDMVALKEFHRVLRPEGFLVVAVPAYRFLWSEHDEALMHRRRYVASELHIKLTCSGFRVLKRSYAVFFAFFPIVFYRLFRGVFPKDPLAPRASHVILPEFLNNLLTALLRIEAWMMQAIDLPWGTSIVVLAQKVQAESARSQE